MRSTALATTGAIGTSGLIVEGLAMKRVVEEYIGPFQHIEVYEVPDDYPIQPEHYRISEDEWYVVSVQDAREEW